MPSLDVAIETLRAQAGAKKFDNAVKKIQQGAAGVDRSVKKSDKTLASFGNQIKGVAGGLVSLAAAYKGVRYVQEAVQEYAMFEAQLANVNTMLDEQSSHFLPIYEERLKDLAVTYGQTTQTLSKGLYDILSASVDAAEAVDVLKVASKASIGGLTSTAIAADALTTIINAYGFEAADAAKVSDLLFTTVKGGKLTFGELASSVGTVASIAASAGLSIEQLSAAIATMTRAGISSDIAMTSLRGIMVTFLSPTKENVEVAKQYGLELNANTLQTIGLTGALQKLTNATKEDIAAIFSNVRALSGIQAIRQNLTGAIEDYEKALNSAGKAEEAYQKLANTTALNIERNRQLWANVKKELGEGIAPEVNIWIQGMSLLVDDWKEAWGEMSEAQKRAQADIDRRMGNWQYLRIIPAFSLMEKAVKKVAESTVESGHRINLGLHEADIGIESLTQTIDELEKGYDSLEKTMAKMEAKDIRLGVEPTIEPFKVTPEIAEAREEINKYLDELKNERKLIGLTNEERERSIRLTEFEAQAKIALGDNAEALVEVYKNELMELKKVYELQEFYDTVKEGIKGVLGAPVEALLDETKSIEDVLKARLRDLGTTLLNQMYEQVIMAPIMNVLQTVLMGNIGGGAGAGTGLFGALFGVAGVPSVKGNAFRNSVRLFAKGDVLSQPTVFPMANGSVGIGGEAGDEALMPLGRDNQGRLGVRTTGEESKQPIKIINVVDQSQFEEYLNTGSGERAVMNIINRNKGGEDLV